VDPLVGTLVLILLALAGARFSFSTERVPQGPRLLFRTGAHFLLLGFLLGPSGLALLTANATEQLSPLLALGLGWVGFHFGLQLNRGNLKVFPIRFHLVGVGQAVLSFFLFLGSAMVVVRLAGREADVPMLLLLGAAATACITTPAGIGMVSSNFIVRGRVRDLLFFIGSLDAGVGILALQVTYSLYRPDGAAWTPGGWAQLVLPLVAAGLGILLGILFIWLAGRRAAAEELVLYILGSCAFAAGGALQWGLSPLFVSVAMGATVANLGSERLRVFALMQRWEKPVYLTFLLLAGALLRLPSPWVLLLAIAYAALRAAAKSAAAATLVAAVPLGFDVPRRLGLGLVPQGGISIAMAVSGVLMYPSLRVAGVAGEASLYTIIVLGVMISELVGPFLTVQLLRRAGEISPKVEEALAEGDQRRAEREALRHAAAAAQEKEADDDA